MMTKEETTGGKAALVGGTLIDGTGTAPLEDSVLILSGSVIEEIGEKEQVRIPEGATVIDVSGKTIMPGMIDCHCHISITNLIIERRLFTHRTVELFQAAEMAKRTLHAGFTTIRDPGTLNDVGFAQAVEMGLIDGPRIVSAGALVQTGGHFDMYYPYGVEMPFLGGGYGGEICDGVPEVQKAARKTLRKGFDFIKISTSGGVGYPVSKPDHEEWTSDELEAIVHEASARGKAVMAHAIGNQGIKSAIRAGVWSVEHGSFADDTTIQMLVDTGTYLVPTLDIILLLPDRKPGLGLAPLDQDQVERMRRAHLDSFRRAAAAGARIALGSDAIREEVHGKNARELEHMVRLGLTPMQALVAATKTASEACRVDDKVGTLEVGKLADLLVVDGNPLDDIRILQETSRLLLIMKEGHIYVDRGVS
jgi:imidazolonepropionase-like amidohydrolase